MITSNESKTKMNRDRFRPFSDSLGVVNVTFVFEFGFCAFGLILQQYDSSQHGIISKETSFVDTYKRL